ncbi:MAG TPA: alpha/beta fold hydrolase [Gemmatimonadales bacterium]|nr:alpha/beta fold hydrolase [Gemmatimonadales bacterium]
MHVILIHGMGRTPFSFIRLARYLRRDGHSVERLGYVAALERFAAICARVRARLRAAAARGEPYAAVGHSLGGLVLRAALADDPPLQPPPAHVIMLGTPNQSPRLARRFARWWPYRLVNGEPGQLLAKPSFYTALPGARAPTTVIVGTGGFCGRWSPFGCDANDGVVAANEARLPGATLIELPVRHTFMMNDRRVVETVRRLLGPTAA